MIFVDLFAEICAFHEFSGGKESRGNVVGRAETEHLKELVIF